MFVSTAGFASEPLSLSEAGVPHSHQVARLDKCFSRSSLASAKHVPVKRAKNSDKEITFHRFKVQRSPWLDHERARVST